MAGRGGAGRAPCQVCLPSSTGTSPGAGGYILHPAQASEQPSAPRLPLPTPPFNSTRCLLRACPGHARLFWAPPTPGRGNAAPRVGHPELAGGPRGTPGWWNHSRVAQTQPSLSLGWLVVHGEGDRGVQDPQIWGVSAPPWVGEGG